MEDDFALSGAIDNKRSWMDTSCQPCLEKKIRAAGPQCMQDRQRSIKLEVVEVPMNPMHQDSKKYLFPTRLNSNFLHLLYLYA
jgi:hypothetical protein